MGGDVGGVAVKVNDRALGGADGRQKPAVEREPVIGLKRDLLGGQTEVGGAVVEGLVRVVELAVESHELEIADQQKKNKNAHRPADALSAATPICGGVWLLFVIRRRTPA